jgi:hypothetical protein
MPSDESSKPRRIDAKDFFAPHSKDIIPRMNVDGHFFETSPENDGLDTAFLKAGVGC